MSLDLRAECVTRSAGSEIKEKTWGPTAISWTGPCRGRAPREMQGECGRLTTLQIMKGLKGKRSESITRKNSLSSGGPRRNPHVQKGTSRGAGAAKRTTNRQKMGYSQ